MADSAPRIGIQTSLPASASGSLSVVSQSTRPTGPICFQCKFKHARCDRTRPACERCVDNGAQSECSYPFEVSRDIRISQSTSSSVSVSLSSQSKHPLGPKCGKCRRGHTPCDRTRPACARCVEVGKPNECFYSSETSQDTVFQKKVTQKTGAPFSGPMFHAAPASPITGQKRARDADRSIEQSSSAGGVIRATIDHESNLTQGSQYHTPQQPAKRLKISETDPNYTAGQPSLSRAEDTTAETRVARSSRLSLISRSISPTLPEDETELRCNLTTEINVQRLKHRNLNASCLRSIMKLLLRSKRTHSSIESAGSRLHDQWLEEDDLMEQAASKLEKGGRCSRALLSRFENFLYGPLMSAEEAKAQERMICVEECVATGNYAPTRPHIQIFHRRLERIILDPLAYGLDDKYDGIESLRRELMTAMSTESLLTRQSRKKFAGFLDPEGDIVEASIECDDGRVGTPSSTRKVPSSVPSSLTSRKTSISHSIEASNYSLSKPALSPTSHSPVTSACSLAATPSLSNIESRGENIVAPFLKSKCRIERPISVSNPSSVSSATYSLQHENERRANRSDQSAGLSTSRSVATVPAQATQPLAPRAPERLLEIYVTTQAPILPLFDLNELKATFAMAANQDQLKPDVIDPAIGLCLAIACHLTHDKNLQRPLAWYEPAVSRLNATQQFEASLSSIRRHALQVEYLHMVGDLEMAWQAASPTIAMAERLWMQGKYTGHLAMDPQGLEQMRLIWQFLSTKQLSLALQLGSIVPPVTAFSNSPMPMRSTIESNSQADRSVTQPHASSTFFLACASLYACTDDLIAVERDLRLTRKECPMKWLSRVDLREFQDLANRLYSWNRGLPSCLEWKELEIDLAMEKNAHVRRMRLLAHMRYTYFRLRLYRPFFILNLRLSATCNCELAPHLPGENMHSFDVDPILALVHWNAIKCITAAQMIVKTLSASFAKEQDDNDKCENLEYLYAAALVLIAALGMGHRGAHADITRSATTLLEQFRQADKLMRNYGECCVLAPKLKGRIERCRNLLDVLENQADPGSSGRPRIIADDSLRLDPVVWSKIYHRLDLDVPVDRQPSSPTGSMVAGRRFTYGWLESQPIDLELSDLDSR